MVRFMQPNRLQGVTSREPGPGFFESLYAHADRDAYVLPWASLEPNPLVTRWLDAEPSRRRGDAAVVGCGLGDDAEALARHGWHVTAFDIAPSAIAWCRERFPTSPVDYVVADLFSPTPHWLRAFGLVVEVFTIQSFPPERQTEVMLQVASLVAPGGTLLVSTVAGTAPGEAAGPPWPPEPEALSEFTAMGLTEIAVATRPSPWPGYSHLEAEYRRPASTDH
jgi:SAM-dependent methyltransferase